MKKLRLLTIIAGLSMTIGAQQAHGQAAILAIIFGDKVASEEFNLSLELGWNFSTVTNFSDIERTSATNFGLGCNFKLSEKFYMSPTVFFLSKRTINFSSYSLDSGNENIDLEYQNTSGQINLSYIDVPVFFWYQMDKFRLGAGPQVSFLTKSTLLFNGDYGDFTQDVKSSTNSVDYGIIAALSYELGKARKGKGIYIQARYYHGFADIYQDPINTGSNTSNYFAVHLSLPFITDELANKNLKKYE